MARDKVEEARDNAVAAAEERRAAAQEQRVAQLEYVRTQRVLTEKTVYSPVNGIVTERAMSAGEYRGPSTSHILPIAQDRKNTRLNSRHQCAHRMPASAGKHKQRHKDIKQEEQTTPTQYTR